MNHYASLCTLCDHLTTEHLLVPEGDLHEGPYRCEQCQCTIAQDGPRRGLTRQGFERYAAQRASV